MSTIFTKIIEREIPAHFIYEDDICVAIMDAFPAVEGQTLVILKREVDYIFDTTDEEYEHLLAVAKKVSKALDEVFETDKTLVFVEGFEVPHVHIKLYPIKDRSAYDLSDLKNVNKNANQAELKQQAEKIKVAL